MSAKPRRLGLIIPWLIFALLAAGWTGYWVFLKTQAQTGVDRWIASQKAAGAIVGYDSVAASGFPLRLTLSFANPHYTSASGGWAVKAPQLSLHVNPSNLSFYIVEPHGMIEWRRGDVQEEYTPKTAAASIRVRDGKLERLSIEATEMDYARDGAPPAHLKALVVSVRPDVRAATDAQIAADIEGLKLAKLHHGFEKFGQDVKTVHARIVAEKAFASFAGDDKLSAWRDAGGAARVEGLALEWGPANLTAKGRFVLDDAKRVAGKLDLDLADPGAALSALGQSPSLPPEMGKAMQRSAEAAAMKGGPLSLPLIVEDGVMTLSGLPIRTVDPIR